MHHAGAIKYRFEPGTVVSPKVEPHLKLLVMKYVRGIYYCTVIGNAEKNNLPFFESQLTDPTES